MPDRSLLRAQAFDAMARGFVRNRRGQALYVCWHGPRTADRAWLLCNAALEEGTFATRSLVQLADALARRGVAAVRMDYAGQGDSEGDLRTLSADDWADDIADLCQWMRTSIGPNTPLGLMGLRAGCLPVLRALPACAAQQVLLVEPVLDGARYIDDALRAHLTTQLACYQKVIEPRAALRERLAAQGVVSVMGHELGQALTTSLEALRLPELLDGLSVPVDIVHLPRLAGRPVPAALQALHQPPRQRVHLGPAAQPWDGASCYWQVAPDCLALLVDLMVAELGAEEGVV